MLIVVSVFLVVNYLFPSTRSFIISVIVVYVLLILQIFAFMGGNVREAISIEMKKGEVSPQFIEGVQAHNALLSDDRLTIFIISTALAILVGIGFYKNRKKDKE